MTGLLDSDLQLTPSQADARRPASVLIVAAEPAASHVAEHLRTQLHMQVEVIADWYQCRKRLQQATFTLLLVEEGLSGTDSDAVTALYDSMAAGWILEANFGLSDSQRIVRQVRSALDRKARNEAHTRTAVLCSLRSQLTSCLTGLLLESQLALRQTGPDSAPALQRILGLAERLSELVQSPDP